MIADYYAVLGLQREALPEEIKKAYKQAALTYHPDKNKAPHAHEQFVLAGQAFYILSDAARRATYDDYLKGRAAGEEGRSKTFAATESAVMRWQGEGQLGAEKHASFTFADFSGDILVALLHEGLLNVVFEGVGAVIKGTGEVLGEVLSNIDL